ncbi:MAG: hypothetical protein KDD61_01975 [Bdellovibrionales bacterium]|nr:hypothetical protein [Bdellovibrionales bacterium]
MKLCIVFFTIALGFTPLTSLSKECQGLSPLQKNLESIEALLEKIDKTSHLSPNELKDKFKSLDKDFLSLIRKIVSSDCRPPQKEKLLCIHDKSLEDQHLRALFGIPELEYLDTYPPEEREQKLKSLVNIVQNLKSLSKDKELDGYMAHLFELHGFDALKPNGFILNKANVWLANYLKMDPTQFKKSSRLASRALKNGSLKTVDIAKLASTLPVDALPLLLPKDAGEFCPVRGMANFIKQDAYLTGELNGLPYTDEYKVLLKEAYQSYLSTTSDPIKKELNEAAPEPESFPSSTIERISK